MIKIYLLILAVLLLSCTSKQDVELLPNVSQDYYSLGNNLFMDLDSNIYFRSIDKSSISDVDYTIYSNYLRYDTLVNNKMTYIILELNKVVDLNSFEYIRTDGLTTYYSDKNRNYFHLVMADGGMLHCISDK